MELAVVSPSPLLFLSLSFRRLTSTAHNNYSDAIEMMMMTVFAAQLYATEWYPMSVRTFVVEVAVASAADCRALHQQKQQQV
jgi:hypothetical protein